MGASWFEIRTVGTSLDDAYNTSRDMAIEESGHDSYNGTISTTIQCADLTNNFKRSGKTLAEYIDMQMDKMQKRDCAAICIQEPVSNKNKTKSQVEHIVIPGTKKWILKYCVYENSTLISSHLTKGDAVKSARAYTEKRQVPTIIGMEKVLEKGESVVAKITYKKSSTEKPGVWRIFGWAAE